MAAKETKTEAVGTKKPTTRKATSKNAAAPEITPLSVKHPAASTSMPARAVLEKVVARMIFPAHVLRQPSRLRS